MVVKGILTDIHLQVYAPLTKWIFKGKLPKILSNFGKMPPYNGSKREIFILAALNFRRNFLGTMETVGAITFSAVDRVR